MKILLDFGHCLSGTDTGARDVIIEEQETRALGKLIKYKLESLGHTVIVVSVDYANSVGESLSARVNNANRQGGDLYVSLHFNSTQGAYGSEVYCYQLGGKGEEYAKKVLNEIISLGYRNRGVKTANFYVIRYTDMPAILVETCFVSDPDASKYNRESVANAIVKGLVNQSVSNSQPQPTPQPITKHPIIGKADLTKEQIVKYILSNNPNPKIPVPIDEFVSYYFEEGAIEGVRPDFAACQSILETACFKFGNDVKPSQCNYSGIGTVENGVAGASFSSARQGVKAQIQHLFGYASTESLKGGQCVDPRYNLLTRGIAPNLEDLSGRWATDSEYASKILSIYAKIKSVKVDSTPVSPQPAPTQPTPPVQNIFTYPNNAQVVGDDLYIRNENGEKIEGRYISDGDHITVLDVSYSKRLILCEYPTSQGMMSGYVKNIPSLIKYYYQGQYHNGSTPEKTYQESSLATDIGELSPYENATPLYRRDGHLHVVYNVGSKENVKSGYCKYDGEFIKL